MSIMPRTLLVSMLGSLALALTLGASVSAQDTTPTGNAQSMGKMGGMHSDMKGMRNDMHMTMHKNMMAMQATAATVKAADMTTGVVDVTAEGTSLKVKFPPKEMASLKAGDKITLHMGFSKP